MERTIVYKTETIKEIYKKNNWFVISWRKRVKTDSVGIDLVISTLKDYDRIIVNGEEVY